MLSRELILQSLSTVGDFVRWGATAFSSEKLHFGHGTTNALDESLALVLHALKLEHDMPEPLLNAHLLEHEKEAVLDLLTKRMEDRTPAPYLMQSARFMGLDFYVDQRVLIPRSPIAEFIELGFSPWLNHEPGNILDLCTGSGCIAIACAHVFSEAHVDGSDVSADALEVAAINVAKHGLENRVSLHQGDLFQAVAGEKYDLIVSNPPYVGTEEMSGLPREYQHEPVMALESGEEGMDIVREILAMSPQYLSETGLLVVEVGNTAEVVRRQFPDLATTWVEFANGGDGVFVITRKELKQAQRKAS